VAPASRGGHEMDDLIAAGGSKNDHQSIELAVVIPTFNERDNIIPLLDSLEIALKGLSWEAIVVDDDSPDGTAELVRQTAQLKPQIRVIHRIGRRGLASACVEGVLSSSAPYFAVIDGDLQHDESLLPRMLTELKEQHLDVVVASRYVEGGSIASWERTRRIISRVSSLAARLIIRADLKDPMSGFFVMRRPAFDETVRNLSQHGFKILLDLFASAPREFQYAELPYQFRRRNRGESKFDGMAVWEFGILLADKLLGRFIPPRLTLFGLVGAFGLLVHLATLSLGLHAGFSFINAQTIAVLTAMTTNFTLNNMFTYCDRQLKGWAFARGLLSFYVICSLGAVANVGVGAFVFTRQPIWWLAGIAGAIVGAVWNYTVSAFFTWNRR
jgi:dolichol-phosphate mannosyltransferase